MKIPLGLPFRCLRFILLLLTDRIKRIIRCRLNTQYRFGMHLHEFYYFRLHESLFFVASIILAPNQKNTTHCKKLSYRRWNARRPVTSENLFLHDRWWRQLVKSLTRLKHWWSTAS